MDFLGTGLGAQKGVIFATFMAFFLYFWARFKGGFYNYGFWILDLTMMGLELM